MIFYVLTELDKNARFENDVPGFVFTSKEDAQNKKEEIEKENPDKTYTIWEIDN